MAFKTPDSPSFTVHLSFLWLFSLKLILILLIAMTCLLLPESRQGPTSGPLNFLFPLPQILFPKLPKAHFLILSEDFLKGHLFSRSSLTVLKNKNKSYNHHPLNKFFQPFCLLFSSPSSESLLHFCIVCPGYSSARIRAAGEQGGLLLCSLLCPPCQR